MSMYRITNLVTGQRWDVEAVDRMQAQLELLRIAPQANAEAFTVQKVVTEDVYEGGRANAG
jgi:hypothetical protein